MKEHVKRYEELTLDELYDLLQLRAEIFVVEQECPYQDLDGVDKKAIHLWMEDEDGLVAYARIINAGDRLPEVSIGRVATRKRRHGWGTRIVNRAVEIAEEAFHPEVITLEAQVYARSLYEKCGFQQCSEIFLEDGIEHIKMERRRGENQ